VRIDPFEDSDAFGRSASFNRVPGLADSSAISLNVGANSYLIHDRGRLVTGAPGNDRDARRRATFRLE
ncbi:MAG TPA: AbfB domain-containing protein, partial [Lentzea sp.]